MANKQPTRKTRKSYFARQREKYGERWYEQVLRNNGTDIYYNANTIVSDIVNGAMNMDINDPENKDIADLNIVIATVVAALQKKWLIFNSAVIAMSNMDNKSSAFQHYVNAEAAYRIAFNQMQSYQMTGNIGCLYGLQTTFRNNSIYKSALNLNRYF